MGWDRVGRDVIRRLGGIGRHDTTWDDVGGHGMGRDGMEWNGVDRMEWVRMGGIGLVWVAWDGMGRMGWDGAGWGWGQGGMRRSGMGRGSPCCLYACRRPDPDGLSPKLLVASSPSVVGLISVVGEALGKVGEEGICALPAVTW